jgi:predicted RNA-binding Zn ribbon-like protein
MKDAIQSRSHRSPEGTLRLLSGHPALDFLNTVDHERGKAKEFMRDFQAASEWCLSAGLLDAGEAHEIQVAAMDAPDHAASAYADIIRMREALRRHLLHFRGSGSDGNGELAQMLTELIHASKFEAGGSVRLVSGHSRLGLPTARLALTIGDLLTFRAGEVRLCAGDPCGWFFLDTSRTAPRRWCSMQSCGNRAKVARHRSAAGSRRAVPSSSSTG